MKQYPSSYELKEYESQPFCMYCGHTHTEEEVRQELDRRGRRCMSMKCNKCKLRNRYFITKKGILRNNSNWEVRRYHKFITTMKSGLSIDQKLLIHATYQRIQNEKDNQVQTNN